MTAGVMNLGREVLADELGPIMLATNLENMLDGNADLPFTSGAEGGRATPHNLTALP